MTHIDSSAESAHVQQEAVDHLRSSAELMRRLGGMGTVASQGLVEERRVAFADQVAQAEQQQEDAALIGTFVRSLPQADPSRQGAFPVTSLEAAKLLDATVWRSNIRANVPHSHDPMYIVGQKMIAVKRDRTDGVVELLLASASSDSQPSYLKARTTMKLWERAEELAIGRLAKPIPDDEIDNYLSPDKTGYELHRTRSNPHTLYDGHYFPQRLTSGILAEYNATTYVRVPKIGKLEEAFWRRIDDNLTTGGLPIEVQQKNAWESPDVIVPDRTTVAEYNMSLVCQKLAVLFGTEDVFGQTIGALEQKANGLDS